MYTPVCILTRNAKACAMKTKIGLLTSIYISFTFVNNFIIKVTGFKKNKSTILYVIFYKYTCYDFVD